MLHYDCVYVEHAALEMHPPILIYAVQVDKYVVQAAWVFTVKSAVAQVFKAQLPFETTHSPYDAR